MRDFLAASAAEILKLKRTLALGLAVLTPLLVVVLQVVFFFRVPPHRLKPGIWPLLEQSLTGWTVLLLPLTAALLTALVNGIEHRDGNWKQLFAQPVARRSVYAAKLLAAHVLLAISTVALWCGLIAAGLSLHLVFPDVRYGTPPLVPLLNKLALIWAAAGALIALHVWVSARAKAFTVPLGLGVGAVLISIMALRDPAMNFWPWMFPANTLMPERWATALAFGVGGGLLLGALGAWNICRRDVL